MADESNNIVAALLEGKTANREAVVTAERSYSYADLSTAAANVAGFLRGSNRAKGDRVVLLSENSFFWVAAYLGVLGSGLVCVPAPSTTSPQDLNYLLKTADAKVVFLQSRLYTKYESVLRSVQVLLDHQIPALLEVPSIGTLAPIVGKPNLFIEPVNDDHLAALMFTSGSTGRPRGVMVTHGNIRANTDSIVEYLGLSEQDRIMTVLPFHYCFGTSLLHTHLRVGGSLVLDQKFLFPEKTLDRMQQTACTGFAGVPSHFQVLLRRTTLRQRSFPSLRYVQQAGGGLHETFQRELREALPGTKIFIMYGQTEATARLAYLPPELHLSKLGSIGKAIPGVSISVLNECGRPVKPGEVGEIVAAGPNIAKGYWRDPIETEKTFKNGRLYTGDRATVDADGFIFLLGRSKDFLKCGGTRVSCKQIEDDILGHGELVEVAVIGIHDELLGEAVKVFVVPRPGSQVSKDELQGYCKSHLPLHLQPREIVILDSLPKNSSGKVLKDKLCDRAATKVELPPGEKAVVNG